MTKKREDLDLTTIVDQAFSSWLEATSLPGIMGTLPPAKVEQMKRSMVAPIFHAIPHIIDALEEKPLETDEDIVAAFSVPDSLEGLTP
jgi:hypothetical protein